VLLARAAGPTATLEGLLAAARGDPEAAERVQIRRLDPRALADLARVIALQRILPGDESTGLALYDLALDTFGPAGISSIDQGVHAELAYHLGDARRATELLYVYPQMPEAVRKTLGLDLTNPFLGADGAPTAEAAAWLRSFQELFDDPHFTLADRPDLLPIDRLCPALERTVESDQKISVIVTCFQPDGGLVTAVRSVLAQSWTNLEVLVVDDGSPQEHDAVLRQCADLDPRVRLIRLEANTGTYVARNAALDTATGDFVTFQDSDDWSHPRRLEHHIRPLLDDETLIATISDALKVNDHLTLTIPGRATRIQCTPSLMFRRATVVGSLGYLDRVRKAADTEYLKRIEAVFGAEAVRYLGGRVYTLMRQTADSLSRSEFRAGWMHPARAAYRSAYGLWHAGIQAGTAAPYLASDPARRPFPAPRHLSVAPPGAVQYDAVFACDWRPFGGPQISMIEEIQALYRRGMRVGVMHLEAFRFMTKQRKDLCRPIQKLINDGMVGQILLDDDVDVALLIIRYPPVLQFAADTPSRVRAKRVIILANQAPSESDGTDLRYVPRACTEIAEALFSVRPQWWPQGPAARAALDGCLPASDIAPFDVPGIVDVAVWSLVRDRFRSDIPVIGRHSRDNWTKWPHDRAALLGAYPDAADIDVRIMGGAAVARAVLGTNDVPGNWLVYDYDEIDVRSFLYQLDFYVYFPHENMIEAFGRAVLEALAAGCVTILPPSFSRTFGDAAVYCEPACVRSVIRRHYADRELFLDQSRRAQERVRLMYSHEAYADLISSVMGRPGGPVPGDDVTPARVHQD
jgi:glycosyltransferase involved in cell wall biosynthesis